MTKTYRNAKTNETAEVIMDGMAAGLCSFGGTCVRKTADGMFAVIATAGDKMFAKMADRLEARRYNFSMHGATLGE